VTEIDFGGLDKGYIPEIDGFLIAKRLDAFFIFDVNYNSHIGKFVLEEGPGYILELKTPFLDVDQLVRLGRIGEALNKIIKDEKVV